MSGQVIAALSTGVGFLIALLLIGCYMAFRTNPRPIPTEAMFIFRVILAVAAAGFAAVLPGFLEIEGKILSFTVRAAGSLAVFIVIYRVNPPNRFEKKLPKPKKPRAVDIPEDRIIEDDEVK